MKISEVLKNNKITVSMEVFPPKTTASMETVENAVRDIAKLNPAFISVTYGAGGGTSDYTVKIASDVKKYGVNAMAHITCVSSTRDTIVSQINKVKDAGIENILALRGDIPEGMNINENQYSHATELVGEIKRIYPECCIGGACYPEGHPEAANKDEDIKHIKEKVDAGCEFLTTQMFFDNSIFYNYIYRLREAGIMVPVLAGIMPITTAKQVERSIQLSGCCVPARFKSIVDYFGDTNEKMIQAGIVYATDQIIDLIANGITHIHVYSMNKPQVAEGIYKNLSEILR